MIKKETIEAYGRGEISPNEIAERKEKPLGTNCRSVELMSFIENGKTIRVIVKKSRIGIERLEEVREEYRKLRQFLSNIIPLQAFITESVNEGGELITAFCAPVTIAYDIFSSERNFEFFKEELENNQDLQNDLNLFIRGYEQLKDSGFYVDLYGEENLIVTREGRLKYIDSFMINMSARKSLRADSEKNFQRLSTLKN